MLLWGIMTDEKALKSDLAKQEEKTLLFWHKKKIFEKTLKKKSPKGKFVFYDGPPFATGLPHYGHLLASTSKDVIPRYKTMKGYHVNRLWGWDCHGLPIENLIEKRLGLNQKEDIEKFGIERFNEEARKSVLMYDAEWKRTISRLGRWIDMESGYKTMDWTYTESIWWAFKRLHTKGLIYEGYKSMHICPRCETTLAVSEVSQGYKTITDISVVAKFELVDEPHTFVLAWTTTPWTLPGNVALAVSEGILYAKVAVMNKETGEREMYILAKDRLSMIEGEHEFIDTMEGNELVGKRYKPLFDYYSKGDIENKENGWKIYPASFVKTDEGTGIVHIAPAFGEDDLEVGRLRKLPFIQHVGMDGVFKKEVTDFAGMKVKPKDNNQAGDIEILKHLSYKNLIFKKEKITHSYPYCWRCDTPLLNYAASSWFVNVVALKDKLVRANKNIQWTPQHLRDGRFGKWLLGARDWAISRSRFWGAPIPIWKCDKCERVEVVGSIEDIRKKGISSSNTYFVMRHGEALSNKKGIVNSILDDTYTLTLNGKKEVAQAIKTLKDKKIDYIISSPLTRTKETAILVASELGIETDDIIFDDRLREIRMGDLEGKSVEEYHEFFSKLEDKYDSAPRGGESLRDVRERVTEFIYENDKKYIGKTILIISHDDVLWMLDAGVGCIPKEKVFELDNSNNEYISTAEVRKLPFVFLPHNASFEIDLHRPYIDRIELLCDCGSIMRRVPEVFDCWFESGSMPYARIHYPFENKKVFHENFPADFISESIDQTRGWFYNMLVLAVGLFDSTAFKSVIVSGMILAEDGQKMSKRLNNYPEPDYILNKYGADALRLYMLSSPLYRAEELFFSEKGVREIQNKVITRLRNVCSFYNLYKDEEVTILEKQSNHVLDIWIHVRLNELIGKVEEALERQELDRATRPLADFVDDLSTWYIRRSRDRFKGTDKEDKSHAIATTRFVLKEFAKVLAPFTPFVAEEIYQKVKDENNDMESVHLERWPKNLAQIPVWPNPMAFFHRIFKTNPDLNILGEMDRVREIVSLALEARSNSGIKVRQPLALLKVQNVEKKISSNSKLIELIKDEVNVKDVVFGQTIEESVELDITLTKELKQEGKLRELIRFIQDLRKKENLEPKNRVLLTIATDKKGKELINAFIDEIKVTTVLSNIIYDESIGGEKIEIGSLNFVLNIKK